MPRPKRISDYTRAERQKGQRRAAGLLKTMRSNVTSEFRKEVIKEFLDIRNKMINTYYTDSEGRRKTESEVKAALKELESANENTNYAIKGAGPSLNYTKLQFRYAGTEASKYSREEVNIIMKATQDMWDKPGVDRMMRLEEIRKQVGNLDRFFDKILKESAKVVELAKTPRDKWTNEQKKLAEELGYEDSSDSDKGSPPYMQLVVKY